MPISLQQVPMGVAQTGNVTAGPVSVNYRIGTEPAAIVISSVAGATPTVTANIQGSVDGTNFINIPYAVQGTFTGTYVVTALTITTTTTQFYMLQPGWPWRAIQVVYTANTNVTLTTTAYL